MPDINAQLTVIDSLSSPVIERTFLKGVVRSISPKDCVRAALGNAIPKGVEKLHPEHSKAFAEITSGLPKYSIFSWMPLSEFIVRLAVVGSLTSKGERVQRATNNFIRDCHSLIGELPAFKMLISAAEHELQNYIRDRFSSNSLLMNFGIHDIEQPYSSEIFLHSRETHPQALLYLLPGYYEGIFTMLGVSGVAEFFDIGDHFYSTRLRWSES